jgi:cobalamin biosynthesis protein CobW
MAKIPTTIITGFLGSGKTTLIQNVIRQSNGRRIAVIVNEFGDQGFDGDLIADCGDQDCKPAKVVELTNGCICCTVADDFEPALNAILALDPAPDHILIETSGLALPKPLVKAFDWPAIRSKVTVDGVIVVIDGPAAASGLFAEVAPEGTPESEHDFPLAEVFEDQLAMADLVIVNKRDLMSDADMEAVRTLVATELKRKVPLLEAAQGGLSAKILLGLDTKAEDQLGNRPTHHDNEGEHDHDDFDSFVLPLPPFADAATAAAVVTNLCKDHGILRAKGFAVVHGKPLRLAIQAVGARVETTFDRAWATGEAKAGQLVVIGLKGLDKAAIAADLALENQAA